MKTLLVHIAFHFVAHRWQYLEKLIRGFNEYSLEKITIVVDSNTAEVRSLAQAVPLAPHCSLRVDVHEQLSHPFALTWAHRGDMERSLADYDAFMYLEDDILVPWETFQSWTRDAPILERSGFLKGFLRVEQDPQGRTVSTDWMVPMRSPRVIHIAGQRYIQPDHFYQACWVYSREQMRRFIASSAWKTGYHRWSSVTRAQRGAGSTNYMREFAAFGMQCARAGRPPVVLPLDASNALPRDCWVWHLPNNYGNDPSAPGGRLAVNELLRGPIGTPGEVAGALRKAGGTLGEAWNWIMYGLHTEEAWNRVARRLRRDS